MVTAVTCDHSLPVRCKNNKEEEDMNRDCKIDCFDVTSKLFAKKIAFIWKSRGKSLSLQAERN